MRVPPAAGQHEVGSHSSAIIDTCCPVLWGCAKIHARVLQVFQALSQKGGTNTGPGNLSAVRCGRIFLAAAVYQGGCRQAAVTSADHQQLHASADSLALPSGELPGPLLGLHTAFSQSCTVAQALQRFSRVLVLFSRS